MNETEKRRSLLIRPAVYRIRICGRLDPAWSERLGGMTVSIIEKQGCCTTELTGQLPDQAALMGVLNQLYLSWFDAHL